MMSFLLRKILNQEHYQIIKSPNHQINLSDDKKDTLY